jgi:probable blue pigment (indigoidine) exporter
MVIISTLRYHRQMTSSTDRTALLVTAIAPVTWGTTYVTTTELLPHGRPLLIAALRALPAGLLLLSRTGHRPDRGTLARLAVLAVFNIGAFFPLLFVAASRLPGGAAAACGAVQPLVVLALGSALLGDRAVGARWLAAAVAGLGVALVVLRPTAKLDPIGLLAALAGTASMGCGVVLAKRWLPGVSGLTAAAWQLTLGGAAIAVAAIAVEGAPPALSARNVAGFAYLSLVGTALAYSLWFRGIQRIGASKASLLGLASPLVATAVGWVWLHQRLGAMQLAGYALALGGIAAGARLATSASGTPPVAEARVLSPAGSPPR